MTPYNFITIRDILRYSITLFNSKKLFFGHGSNNAFDEASYLILHTLKLPLNKLEPFLDARLLSNEINKILYIINQRVENRIPAAYLTNEAWLNNYSFFVDKRVIIPRSFIAELILEQFIPWIENPSLINYTLDLCTGSGCLSILLADAFPQTKIDAIDISSIALEVAFYNIKKYALNDRINLIESDLYTVLPKNRRYDLIVSNPPYIDIDTMNKLPIEYQHEPQLALIGGIDGMDIVRKIIKQSINYLTPQGSLIVEIGNGRSKIEASFPNLEFCWLSTSTRDNAIFFLTAKQLKILI